MKGVAMKKVVSAEMVLTLIQPQAHPHAQVTDDIWGVFKLPEFKKSTNGDLEGEAENSYKAKILEFVKRGDPVGVVLVAFPWKMWRMPLKTNRKTPDFGEFAFLSQVRRFDEAVQRVYAPGTHWTFLTEGGAYNHLFDVPEEEYAAYVNRLKDFSEMLGISQKVSFLPLRNILERFTEFPKQLTMAYERLRVESPTENGTIPQRYRQFFGTFYTSLDLRHLDMGTLRRIFHQRSAGDMSLSPDDECVTKELGQQAKEMVLKYVAFNEAKNLVGQNGAIQDSFPDHMYISITQKPGRYTLYPIHRRAKILPHHGVPVVRKDGRVTIEWLDSVLYSEQPFIPVFLEGDVEALPFFYEER